MYGRMTESGIYDIGMSCNTDCGCPVSRMQPICSKDGVTNFYSPCHAGCRELQDPPANTCQPPGLLTTSTSSPAREKEPAAAKEKVYRDCSCVAAASQEFNTSISYDWIVKDKLTSFSHPPSQSLLQEAWERLAGESVTEATEGWCEVPGCKTQFIYWMVAMAILSILGSTSRVGNVLVALRCVDISDKSLSFAIQVGPGTIIGGQTVLESVLQVVALSLLAMLPSPMIFGAIIDNTCILWQEECGETTNCLLYDTDRLRRVLMLTTAAIMLIGVLFDIAVVYYAKDLDIFDTDKKDLEMFDSEKM